MAYIDSEESTSPVQGNALETTDTPQIHLSANDGLSVAAATQLVAHKQEDGKLFIEIFTRKDCEKYLPYYTFTLDDAARAKLREFLNCPVTY